MKKSIQRLKFVLFSFISVATLQQVNGQTITTICGNGTPGFSGDGGAATSAQINASVAQIATDNSGNIYIADVANNRIRRINAVTGVITTVAGNGTAGFSGDGGLATSAQLNGPYGVCVDGSGNIYISDYNNNRIRRVNTSGIISTYAGTGVSASTGDGGLANLASVSSPGFIDADAAGNIYFTEYNGYRVRSISTTSIINTIMGNGTNSNTGNGGLASLATIAAPWALAVDRANGDIYVSSYFGASSGYQLRRISSSSVTAVAGNGTTGFSGDGGLATAALTSNIEGIAVNNGRIFFSDRNNQRIRVISNTGIITTYAGNGTLGFSGDGGIATSAQINSPSGVALWGCQLFFLDDNNSRIRRVSLPSPTITVNSGTICSGNSFTIVPSGASSYTFQGGGSVKSPTVTSTYSVIGTNSVGCLSNIATSTVNVNSSPTISANSGTICSGNSFTIVPSGANTYTIQGGSAAVSPTANASYTVIGTNTITGCVSANTATSNVTVNALPSVTVTGNTLICGTGTNVLNASGANTYSWNTGATTNTISVSPTVTTNYTVVGTSTVTGCAKTTTLFQNVGANPTITVNSGSICAGNSFTITPSGASTYTYSGGSAVVSPTATAAYTVTGTNTVGCNGSAVSNVTVNALPTVSAASSNTAFICVGSSATLTASGASSYVWNTTATTAVIAVSPTTTTSYTVTGTGANGCSANAVLTQSVSTCTGIDNLSFNVSNLSFQVYPNPSNGIFNIDIQTSTSLSLTSIEVTDVLGRVILTDKVNAGNYQLNLGNNVNGVYFVKATVDGKTKTVKIIKE